MLEHNGYFGDFGGCYAPETLIEPLRQLSHGFIEFINNADEQRKLNALLKNYVGRPTPLYHAKRLSAYLGGAQIYLKREDLAHTGAHKINNALAQGLLAQFMGKTHLIAETGAGQHGVATATVASLLGLNCTIYMGEVDMQRQAPNVARMRALGAEVVAVTTGTKTLVNATSEAIRTWVTQVKDSYYLIGSALGPHPYPTIVREFQKIIGIEARRQYLERFNTLPDELVACIGGGSNAIGLFYPFLNDSHVKMTGVEAGGTSLEPNQHAARFATGRVGVLQGSKTRILQNEHGLLYDTHSISAGLDYPAVGPEHAYLHQRDRVQYTFVLDQEALNAALMLARYEGILPALESAHAIAYTIKQAAIKPKDYALLVNLSGRGDKDMATYQQYVEV